MAALLAICVARVAAQAAPEADPVLLPGDAVRIHVWQMEGMSGEFDIDAAGKVLHPKYQSVTVTGIPLSVAHDRIKAIVNQWQTGAEFTLQPLLRVTVEGEVRNPGVERHPPVTTISQAIVLAGGLTERGRMDRVRLVRGDVVTVLDLRDPTDPALRMPIRSGDRIIVDISRTLRETVIPLISVLGTAASIANLFRRR